MKGPACSKQFISHPYMTIGKIIALTRWTFVGKVMSLLCNMLSRLVITFLPRNKRLLISWLQSPSAVILEPTYYISQTAFLLKLLQLTENLESRIIFIELIIFILPMRPLWKHTHTQTVTKYLSLYPPETESGTKAYAYFVKEFKFKKMKVSEKLTKESKGGRANNTLYCSSCSTCWNSEWTLACNYDLPIVTLMFVYLSKVYSPINLYYAMLPKNHPKIKFKK